MKRRDDVLMAVVRCAGDYRALWRWLESECGVMYDLDLERGLLEAEALNRGLDVAALKREREHGMFTAQIRALETKMLLYQAEAQLEESS